MHALLRLSQHHEHGASGRVAHTMTRTRSLQNSEEVQNSTLWGWGGLSIVLGWENEIWVEGKRALQESQLEARALRACRWRTRGAHWRHAACCWQPAGLARRQIGARGECGWRRTTAGMRKPVTTVRLHSARHTLDTPLGSACMHTSQNSQLLPPAARWGCCSAPQRAPTTQQSTGTAQRGWNRFRRRPRHHQPPAPGPRTSRPALAGGSPGSAAAGALPRPRASHTRR